MTEDKLLASLLDYPEDGIYDIVVDQQTLLLIINKGNLYLIENKCGHFGVPFVGGKVDSQLSGNEIVCAEHGISFDLATGEIVNRPYENCDPIKVYSVKIIDNKIYWSNSKV